MPNDKDPNLNPEEPEEKKYSFLQETIKPKPISRQQLVKQLVRIAIYGVILGGFACLGFFALRPWAQDMFRGDLETVTIPEDEEETEDTGGEAEEETPAEAESDADSYEEMIASMNDRADEAKKGLATVTPVQAEQDWNEQMTGIHAGVTGVIMADNGQELLILTDDSVCGNTSEWTVTFEDGKSYTGSLKKRDSNSGLAVFSVARNSLTDETWAQVKVSVLGNSNLAKQGDVVMALGNMFGYPGGMGYGVLSSTEQKASFYDGECDVLSTDIAADAAGTGILFNMDGEVIGMISSSIWEKENAMVNAYAVSDLKSIIEILANGENVPHIGVYGTTVTQQLQEEQGMPAGVYVVDIDPDSPAMEAGIQIGDIICQVQGEDVTTIGTYQSALLKTKAGRVIRLTGQRRGADGYVEVEYSVTVGSRE